MEKRKLRVPFFVVNPKSYLYGEQVVELAKYTDALAVKLAWMRSMAPVRKSVKMFTLQMPSRQQRARLSSPVPEPPWSTSFFVLQGKNP